MLGRLRKCGTEHGEVAKGGNCALKIGRSVPILCEVDPDRYMYVSQSAARPGDVIGSFVNVFAGESLRWEVRGGTIESTNGLNVTIAVGAPGVLEIDAYISKNGCELKVSRSVVVACTDDPTIGLFFDKGGVHPGEVVTASANLREGMTAHWEIVNGTPATADGQQVQITAGASGLVEINLYVTHRTYCTLHRRAFIFIFNN